MQRTLTGGRADAGARPAGGTPWRGAPAGRAVGMADLLGRRLVGAEARGAPPAVHVAGPMPIPVPGPRVSVVGSRAAPPAGLAAARDV